jgi:hypothetical protein
MFRRTVEKVARLGLIALVMAAPALADGFTITLGSPVASQDYRSKTAAFVFRTEGCANPAKAQFSGTAEGLAQGTRRSLPLKVTAMDRPGVYAVFQTWPAEGEWVVNLRGSCAAENAGVLVAIGPRGFIRDSAKFFRRPATSEEVEMFLKGLEKGGNR